jgi:diguanylate cyclase (GGDEF)-like protein
MLKFNITNKLATIIIAGIVSFAICLGIYFDNYLKDTYYEEAKKKIEYGFSRMILEVQKIESNLKSGISFVQYDEAFIASIDLINSYQNKNNYNKILLDEEKKLIASKLLDKVKLSLNDDITLYDRNDELIASVKKENNEYILSFLSYKNGQTLIFSKTENQYEYTKKALSNSSQNEFKHTKDSLIEKENIPLSAITYFSSNDDIYIKSHLNIKDMNTQKSLAHIEMAKKLDKNFFDSLSNDINVSIVINSKINDNKSNSKLLSDVTLLENLQIKQTPSYYHSRTLINATNKIVGVELFLDKEILLDALNEIRTQIFLMIVVILIFMLLILRFIFHILLAKPFHILMNQIQKIEKRDYSNSEVLHSGDELEVISRNVNNLALALESRENELQATYDNLLYFSNRDSLTMLANRRYFISELELAIKMAEKNNQKIALLFIDLDYFKDINDTLGHNIGDKLLQTVSNKLLKIIDENGLVGRFGGDEFVVLLKKVENEKNIKKIAIEILESLQEKFKISDLILKISASIGISIFPNDANSVTELIKQSDLAMYHSKELGKNTYSFFTKELSNSLEEKTKIINALKEALENKNEFQLLYQPKISAKNGKMISIESLVRWNSKTLGFVYPSKFISIAEETNMIIPLGEWILRKACSDFQKLLEEGLELEHISINVSPVQLKDEKFFSILNNVIKKTNINPKKIELEITESFIATDSKNTLEILNKIRQKGIALAIDDFGTGYSSMSYLKKLPINRLKIDKSFVDELPVSQESVAIAKAIISLAKTFGLQITAEGVETKEQLDFLIKEKCDEIQGYYYSKPITLEEIKLFQK